jgi:hypothetical protein
LSRESVKLLKQIVDGNNHSYQSETYRDASVTPKFQKVDLNLIGNNASSKNKDSSIFKEDVKKNEKDDYALIESQSSDDETNRKFKFEPNLIDLIY